MIQDITPTKSQFRMDDALTFEVHLVPGFLPDDTVKIQIFHLGHLLFEEKKKAEVRLEYHYAPGPGSKAAEGFWVRAVQLRGGVTVSQASTACDRASSWSCAPRYGFLSDFDKREFADGSDVRQMNRYHLNVVQFYDWMYRHHGFFPPHSVFQDAMGKTSSMDTVKKKIELLHRYGMKAFAYGAVYGAEEEYRKDHPVESLFNANGQPMKFIDRIYFMDINRNCKWHDHIIDEYRKAIDFGFDGIHMDQYGFPKEAYARENGKSVLRKLRDDFPALINDTKAALPGSGVIFNAVNDWPVDTVATTAQDCVYIEVWPPNDTYDDLNRLIADAKKYAPNKQVILAAYLRPFSECENPEGIMPTAFLAMATIFSSGGFHLLLGENNGLLTQAYYSDYCHLQSQNFISKIQNYYDFITAYEELLFDCSLIDDTKTYTGGINDDYLFSGVECSTAPKAGCVWTQVRHKSGYKVIHLVNFSGITDMNWNCPQAQFPRTIKKISVDAEVAEDVEEVRLMSPDLDGGASRKLKFTNTIRDNGCRAIRFTVPELKVWDLISIQVKQYI